MMTDTATMPKKTCGSFIKRLVSFLMVFAMVFSLCVPAMAATKTKSIQGSGITSFYISGSGNKTMTITNNGNAHISIYIKVLGNWVYSRNLHAGSSYRVTISGSRTIGIQKAGGSGTPRVTVSTSSGSVS